jgi:integrase
MNFDELVEWYLGLEKVKAIKTVWRIEDCLNNWKERLGNVVVDSIKPADVEGYQIARKGDGVADATVDKEITTVKSMVRKAFHNDLVGGHTLKVFERIDPLLKKKNANARGRVLSFEEYVRLTPELAPHLRAVFGADFFTGMRRGELLNLTWDKVDLKGRMIRLEAKDTKEEERKVVPICDTLLDILKALPRALHVKHVFLFNTKPIKDIRTGLRRACQKSDVPYGQNVKNGFIFRDLRRTVKTNMARAGVDKVFRDTILGHSLKGMDTYYIKPSEEDLLGAIGQYEAWVNEQLKKCYPNVTQAARI